MNARAVGQKKKIGRANQGNKRKVCSTAKLETEVNRKSLNQTGGGSRGGSRRGEYDFFAQNRDFSHEIPPKISAPSEARRDYFKCPIT